RLDDGAVDHVHTHDGRGGAPDHLPHGRGVEGPPPGRVDHLEPAVHEPFDHGVVVAPSRLERTGGYQNALTALHRHCRCSLPAAAGPIAPARPVPRTGGWPERTPAGRDRRDAGRSGRTPDAAPPAPPLPPWHQRPASRRWHQRPSWPPSPHPGPRPRLPAGG